jgi:hypothetical protein
VTQWLADVVEARDLAPFGGVELLAFSRECKSAPKRDPARICNRPLIYHDYFSETGVPIGADWDPIEMERCAALLKEMNATIVRGPMQGSWGAVRGPGWHQVGGELRPGRRSSRGSVE